MFNTQTWCWHADLLLVHEVKALVGQQRSKALAEVVVGVFSKRHLLYRRQLTITWPDLLTGRSQVLSQHTQNRKY